MPLYGYRENSRAIVSMDNRQLILFKGCLSRVGVVITISAPTL